MNTCCKSRVGIVKASYPDREKALKGAKRQRDRIGEPFEPYECYVHPGRYHIRKVRVRREQAA